MLVFTYAARTGDNPQPTGAAKYPGPAKAAALPYPLCTHLTLRRASFDCWLSCM